MTTVKATALTRAKLKALGYEEVVVKSKRIEYAREGKIFTTVHASIPEPAAEALRKLAWENDFNVQFKHTHITG